MLQKAIGVFCVTISFMALSYDAYADESYVDCNPGTCQEYTVYEV